MSDHTVIAILVGILTALAAAVGYLRGEQKRRDQRAAIYIRQLEEHERKLRAQGAILEAIAEDYDPIPENGKRRKRLPEGWSIIEGGGVLLLLAALGTWIRSHWRTISGAAVAAGAAAVAAVAILHGAPPVHHPGALPPPVLHHTAGTAFTTPTPKPSAPITKPGRTHRTALPPAPLIPVRRRPPTEAQDQPAATSPALPPLQQAPATGAASPSPAHPSPTPSPTATCPFGLTLRLIVTGVTVCV